MKFNHWYKSFPWQDSYEIIGDTVTNEKHCGPRKSRLRTPKDPGLLNGMQFFVIGSSQGLVPGKEIIKALKVLAGLYACH